jgi:aspartate-semialdehyde dehydrogenase
VGSFDREGNSIEEVKVAIELKKIWRDDDIKISCTAVRVPVLRGHSLAVWVKTEKPWRLIDIEKILRKTKGAQFFKNPCKYPTPLETEKTFGVKVGRLRKSETSGNEFQMWIVSDNLYKGAALNSIQIAEYIIKKYL